MLISIVAAFTGSVQDPDYWWHLRTGAWMLASGSLPHHDLYTYTVPNHGWVDHEYLTEVLLALLYRVAGMTAISFAFGAATWLGFLFIWKTAQAGRRPYIIAGLGLALGALAGAPIWGPRPQMITFLFSCIELHWLDGYLRGRSRTINWLPLLLVPWANLHGGFVVAFVFLGIAIAAELLLLLIEGDQNSRLAHWRRLRTLGIVLGLSLVAVLATPNGIQVYTNPFETLTSPAQRRLIVEWFSPDFHMLVLLPFLAMILLLLVGFTLRRPSAYQLLLTIAALTLALQSVRNVAIFTAAATPVLIEVWSGAWQDFAAARGWKLGSPGTSPLLRAVTALALIVIVLATGFRMGHDLATQGTVTRQQYPVAAADWLAAHPDAGTRMYNQYGWGGYLVERFYPNRNRRVFIFGEASVMGDSFLQQYQDVQTLRPDWQAVLDRYQVDYVVYNRGEALSNVLATEPDKWCLAYSDDVAVIYLRRDTPAAGAYCPSQ